MDNIKIGHATFYFPHIFRTVCTTVIMFWSELQILLFKKKLNNFFKIILLFLIDRKKINFGFMTQKNNNVKPDHGPKNVRGVHVCNTWIRRILGRNDDISATDNQSNWRKENK